MTYYSPSQLTSQRPELHTINIADGSGQAVQAKRAEGHDLLVPFRQAGPWQSVGKGDFIRLRKFCEIILPPNPLNKLIRRTITL